MTDNTQELGEILKQNFSGNYEISCTRCSESIDISYKPSKNAKQAILDWHNKQIEAVLDRLLEHGEDFTSFGDGHRSVAVEYIEAERNKLKEIE